MKCAEMFSGIGGFRLGLERANICQAQTKRIGKEVAEAVREGTDRLDYEGNQGLDSCIAEGSQYIVGSSDRQYDCVWANDFDKYACQIYRKHYGEKELVEADIRQISTDDIPDFDLLTAGFPCQSFSLAGKRKGFQDIRGTLFYEVVRVASAKRPKLLLLENVKGLLSNDNGKTFGTILESLGSIGYWCEWQTLNSKHFGVPQNRERVFIVGHLRTEPTRQIFPIGTGDSIPFEEGECEPESGETSFTLEATYSKNKSLHNMLEIPKTSWAIDANYFKGTTVKNSLEKHRRQLVIHALYPRTGNPEQGGTGHLTRISPESYALDAHNSMAIEEGTRIRRLTPTECERLQGFPDGWTKGVSDTQRYKLLGNAVTTNVISFLGEKLLEASV